jgi:hemolysin III
MQRYKQFFNQQNKNNKKMTTPISCTKREEILNTLTHLIGIIIVSIGSGVLLTLSVLSGSAAKIAAVSIYGLSMILLYCASTLYHNAENENTKAKLNIFDHCAIYLLIAGTYTPFLLINLKGTTGTILLIIMWTMAVLGITAKLFFYNKFKKLSLAVYLIMGWMVVFAIRPMIENMNTTGLIFLLLGGLFYSSGTYFYAKKKAYYHCIWHVFVLLGTIMHFFAILYGSIL